MHQQSELYTYSKKELNQMYDRIQEFLTEVIVNIGVARGEHYSIAGQEKYTRKALRQAGEQCLLLQQEIHALLKTYDRYNRGEC